MSTYTTAKYGFRAPNGDEPLLSSDNLIRDGFDDVDTALDNLELTYRTIIERIGYTGTAPTAGTYVLQTDATGAGPITTPPNSWAETVLYLDPADYTIAGRSTKLRVRAQIATNAVAPGTDWTVGLYPVSTIGGGSGSSPTVTALGSVTSGSTVAFSVPGATSQDQDNSGDFTPPTAGFYVLAALNSGAAPSGSSVALRATLQMRQV